MTKHNLNLIKSKYNLVLTVIQRLLCFSLIITIGLNQAFARNDDLTKKISGKVVTDDNLPALGCAVLIKKSGSGIIVEDDGTFTIEATPDDVLVFSLIGYKEHEVQVGTQSYIRVILENETLTLNDAVVVAYGVQKKATITGAVNSVNNEIIERAPTANITNSLTGTLSGLTSVQRSGEPGRDGATFKVRGNGTLTDAGSAPLILIDGVERESLDLLDPSEVESVNILKDASATAVFGVRGANGVILVTTKTGDTSKPRVTFTSNFGWQGYTMMPKFTTATEWMTLYNEGLANTPSASNQPFTEEHFQQYFSQENPVLYSDVDWVNTFLTKSAPQQKYNLNVSGGTDKVKYFASLGLLHQAGMYKEYDFEGVDFSINPDYKKYNIRANIDIELLKGLTLGVKLGVIYTNGNYSNMSTGLIFDNLLRTVPFGPAIIGNKLIGGFVGNDPLKGIRRFSNIYFDILEEGYQESNTATYNLSSDLKYDLGFITSGLSTHIKMAYDDYGSHTVKYKPTNIPRYAINVNETFEGGYQLLKTSDESTFNSSESYSNSRYRNIYFEAGIDYAKTFGNHNITTLLLYNQRVQNSPSFDYHIPKGLLGFVGRVTYNYDSRYLAEFNVGYNGSENFAVGKRFGLFPAVSLGWVLTEEKFIPKNNILTYAKIRGSYGEVGNDRIGGERYLYLPSTYNYGTNGYNVGIYGVNRIYYEGSMEGKTGNPDVTWERARKANIGIEFKLFGNRLNFVGDYFYENRRDILWNYGTVPTIVGATFSAANIGKVNNQGYELELGWQDQIGDFSYWAKGIYSFARNKIQYMDEASKKHDYMMSTGYSVGQLKGYLNEGFINTQADLENRPHHSWGADNWAKGELNFVDVDGDGIIGPEDKVPTGYSAYPEITYGINFGINWKGIEVSALFQGAANVTLAMKQSAVCPLYLTRSAQKWHMGRWTEERYLAGEEITYPRMLLKNDQSPSFIGEVPESTFWYQDASYLRLRNLEIAYTFKHELIKKAGITSLRVYANGSNLLTITGTKNFDPESPAGIGSFYPMPKVYNFGLNSFFKLINYE
jgi:TonB-linked outer membrane protein, SusC/RagA family/TonB-dependent outer membrane receptor, SusC/RagA subfamily, signature region